MGADMELRIFLEDGTECIADKPVKIGTKVSYSRLDPNRTSGAYFKTGESVVVRTQEMGEHEIV